MLLGEIRKDDKDQCEEVVSQREAFHMCSSPSGAELLEDLNVLWVHLRTCSVDSKSGVQRLALDDVCGILGACRPEEVHPRIVASLPENS